MSINAISAISAYSPYSNIDIEYDGIKQKLAAMGIAISGNKSVDKSRLEKAQQEQILNKAEELSKNSQSSPVSAQTSTASETENATFRSILTELGIVVTKDIEYDYRKAINAIRTKLLTETDNSNITHLNNLKDNLDSIMVNLGYSPIAISMSEKTGASTVSDLNKTMMVSTSAAKQ